jgi:hypothetical protein
MQAFQQIASQPDAVLSKAEGQAARSAFVNAEWPIFIYNQIYTIQ